VNVIANWIRKALRDFLQQTLTTAFFLRLIGVFFDLLHKGVGVIPGSFDDKALADFEATVDKPALAASMQKAVLDFLMPGSTRPSRRECRGAGVVDGVPAPWGWRRRRAGGVSAGLRVPFGGSAGGDPESCADRRTTAPGGNPDLPTACVARDALRLRG
jgi:hypothetical protein